MRNNAALSNIRLLGLFNFFSDFRLFGPVMIIYFAHVSGSYALAGTVIAIKMVSSAVFELPMGVVSDRTRRIRVTLAGAIASTAAIATYAVAPSFGVLAVGAIFEGLSGALWSGNNDSLLWDSLASNGRESEFHHCSGRVNAAFQIALAISAVIGGIIAGWSLRMTMVFTVIPQIASVVVALFMVEPERMRHAEPEHPVRQLLNAARLIMKHRQLRRLTFASAIDFGFGESGSQFQGPFIAALWPAWALGVIRAANHGTSVIGFWWAGRVIDRFGPSKASLGGSLLGGIVGLVAYGKPTVVSPALTLPSGVGFGVGSTAQTMMSHEMFTDRERSTMASFGQFAGSLLYGAVAIAAGAIGDAYGPRWALLLCTVGSLAGIPAYWLIHRERLQASRLSPGAQSLERVEL